MGIFRKFTYCLATLLLAGPLSLAEASGFESEACWEWTCFVDCDYSSADDPSDNPIVNIIRKCAGGATYWEDTVACSLDEAESNLEETGEQSCHGILKECVLAEIAKLPNGKDEKVRKAIELTLRAAGRPDPIITCVALSH